MKDKAQWRWSKSTLRYMTESGVNVFDWSGNSVDLTPIEEVWNIMKKNLVSFQTIRKNFEITFVTYGIVFIKKLLRNCMMKYLQWWKRKAKGESTIY